jgi:hypothetical protein
MTKIQLYLPSPALSNQLSKLISIIQSLSLKKSSSSDKVLEKVKSCNLFSMKSKLSKKDLPLISKDTHLASLSSRLTKKLVKNSTKTTQESQAFKTPHLGLL